MKSLKFGVITLAILFLFGGLSVASVYSAPEEDEEVLDDKGEVFKVPKKKVPYYMALRNILKKKVLDEKDFDEIRENLEKIEDRKLTDEEWNGLRKYTVAEHKKARDYKKHNKNPSQKPKGTTTTAVKDIPTIFSWYSIDYLPEVIQPWTDVSDGNNGILKVYYFGWSNSIEITIVFKDEDHPYLDAYYDALRWAQYGRIEDIEYFFVNVNTNGNPTSIYFPGTSSRSQTFNVFYPTHYTDTYSQGYFSWNGVHPYIYVNTWNHLYGYQDNNPGLTDTWWWHTTYPTKLGTKADAENDY